MYMYYMYVVHTCIIYIHVHTYVCTVEILMPQTQSKRSTGVRIDS